MDRTNNYYLSDLQEDVAKFFVNLIGKSYDNSLCAQIQNTLVEYIFCQPFPCLRLLDSLARQKGWTEFTVQCKTLALQKFVQNYTNEEVLLRFINFLVNVKLTDDVLEKWAGKIIDVVKKADDTFYMGFLARQDFDVYMISYTRSLNKANNYFVKDKVLYEVIRNNVHFVSQAVQKQKTFIDISNNYIRNVLILAKASNELNSVTQSIDDVGNIKKILEGFDLQVASEIQVLFFNDLRRLQNSIEFLRKYTSSIISVEMLVETNGILPFIYEHKNIMFIGYEEIRQVIESNHAFECQSGVLKQMRDIELETLIYFFVLAAIYEMIVNRGNTDGNGHKSPHNKISHIKTMLRQIRNIDVLCSLIEDIFHLIFLRWEHLASPSFGKLQDSQKKKSTSSEMETHVELNSGSTRHGFICSGMALKYIFVFLKNFITKKLHSEEYKTCSDRIQRRFTRIIDCINDALWKYSVLEKIADTDIDSFQMEPEDLLQLVQLHKERIEKTSSDDESRERNNFASLARRKAKKRRRATFGGGEQQRSEELSNKDIRSNDLTEIENRKSIIPNMLSTPENLAIMALAMKNFNDVKYIIQTFNLHNTELDRELKFVENQQQTKKKLEAIYESYLLQEMKSNDCIATVEQIKKAAAKGFEASKITSIIDNFAHSNTVEQSPEVVTFLEKYSSSYSFLFDYESPNIQAVIAVDLILNLNINYDILSNVIPVIRRKCNLPKLSNSSITNTGLPSEMGCLNFLDNICECMRLIKTIARTEIGLQNMLCNNSYSLRPKKIMLELQREKIFQNVFYKNEADLYRIEDLKVLANEFTDLKSKCNYFLRFLSYVVNLSKFLRAKDKNAEFHTRALLKFDPSDVIGELIFEENMTPLEIESQVVALNLNLVHVIALNICPEISDKEPKKNNYKITKEKYQSIFNYIANQNALLGYLLQKIKGSSSQCSNINDEYLERLVRFESVKTLSEIYEGNQIIAALMSTKVNKGRIKKLQKKKSLFDILQHFGDQLQDKKAFHREKDRIIADLVSDDAKYVYLAEHISNINVRASLIHTNFTKVPNSRLAKELIESTLLHKDAKYIDNDLKNKLEQTLQDINIYSKVSSVLELESWPQAYDFGLKTPNMILENLLSQRQFKLCYAWCNVVRLGTSFSHQTRHFFSTFLDVLIDLREEFDPHLLQTIETFPTVEVYNFYDTHKEKFRSVSLLNYVIDFLWKNARSKTYLKNYKVSLKIFEQLSAEEREQNWNLLSRPLLIVEQLIMNAKFKGLAKVLDSIRGLLEEFQTDTSTLGSLCKFCFDKRGNIYDIHSKNSSNFTLGNESSSAFILLNFNLYQKDHIITSECIDLLLRIYATKALDYQIREISSSSERVSQSTDMASLDSLCGAFIMPKVPPRREEWVQDEDAVHCMCCRRVVFTMLMRRHHCRRCGRVVCFACSSNRMQILELYEDVAVRVCSDCIKQTQELEAKNMANKSSNPAAERRVKCSDHKDDDSRWKLSGNITHDKLLREEFCYEHAPSVALCLSILSYHKNNRKCVDLLLYHCGKLEKLLVPNPEVDYELIAKMMNCLALAAKVRGGPPEVETIREHSDIIMSVVQNGCESLIPAGSLNNHNLRKLADSLVQVEKWQLALEIHWKCGFPTAGVMAAHGLACLRAGCFETAREKFSHCMTKLSSERECSVISKLISNDGESIDNSIKSDIPIIKRSSRSPPLLQEILKMIESVPSYKSQPETIARAAIIRNSNSSLSSVLSKRREHIPLHEPAINILNTLANLKQLSKGHYCDNGTLNSLDNKKQLQRQSRTYEECLYYLYTYGSHSDLINFFIYYEEINAALKYFILQHLDVDIFIHHIFLVFLKTGSVGELIDHMIKIDESLVMWKEVIIGTCRYLETKNLYHCLYELQILLKDPVRASMTCVKFYSMHCQTYQELYANSFHLHNAHRHMQSELEHSQWENMNPDRKRKISESSFLMQMDAKSINAHINTILRQMDVTKFLSHCEQTQPLDDGRLITDQVLKQIRIDSPNLPTLFDSAQEKTQICILLLLCGNNIEEGFGLSYRIIQNYKLPSMKVFGATAKYLARNNRLSEVEKLLNCVTSNNGTTSKEIDEILSIAINSATNNHEPEVKTTLDNLAKKINSVELRISSHIFIGQLKSAYLLAIQHNRLTDIRKILRQAEATNQLHIKKLCEKKLNMSK